MSPLKAKLENFTRLSASDRDEIERLAGKSVRSFEARRDLVREGDPPRAIFLMLEGWACRYKALADGRRQIVGLLLPGDWCDLNVFLLREMDHNIAAISPLTVAEVGREDFDDMIERSPRILRALWWHELVAMAIQREWTLNIGQRAAFERIGHLLCELFLRLQSVGLTRGGGCDFPLRQNDLADATGLTAVHVNRTLQELRRVGLIEFKGRELRIPDLGALKVAALFNDNYLHLGREGAQYDADD